MSFNIPSYPARTADQGLAQEVLEYTQENDLVVRDRGFLFIDSLRGIQGNKAPRLSRFPASLHVSNQHGVLLQELLKKTAASSLELNLILGAKARFPCRLIAVRLPKEEAEKNRRERGRASAKHGRVTSKQGLILDDWRILITNLTPREQARGLRFNRPRNSLHCLYQPIGFMAYNIRMKTFVTLITSIAIIAIGRCEPNPGIDLKSPLIVSTTSNMLLGTFATVSKLGTGIMLDFSKLGSDEFIVLRGGPAHPTLLSPYPESGNFRLESDRTDTADDGDSTRVIVLVDRASKSDNTIRVLRYVIMEQLGDFSTNGKSTRAHQRHHAVTLSHLKNSLEVTYHKEFHVSEDLKD